MGRVDGWNDSSGSFDGRRGSNVGGDGCLVAEESATWPYGDDTLGFPTGLVWAVGLLQIQRLILAGGCDEMKTLICFNHTVGATKLFFTTVSRSLMTLKRKARAYVRFIYSNKKSKNLLLYIDPIVDVFLLPTMLIMEENVIGITPCPCSI
ncbi:hypothetical protein F3Y22_tig00113725pilonHSYRG01629 [Hibiscus syriacus]|uniref:Uncharacterized protein n=1 Tax=Hibiscus syriacus TaxID=106335 RepID=A0A6A2XHS4_HIBSY|nr:hypothetical protein F3Y22_tig00113725pilonHSYRG01629 [Hibiscus syriacus]